MRRTAAGRRCRRFRTLKAWVFPLHTDQYIRMLDRLLRHRPDLKRVLTTQNPDAWVYYLIVGEVTDPYPYAPGAVAELLRQAQTVPPATTEISPPPAQPARPRRRLEFLLYPGS